MRPNAQHLVESLGRICAAGIGLSGFAVSMISGLWVGASAKDTLVISIVSAVCCYAMGLMVGTFGSITVREHLGMFHRRHPVPAQLGTGAEGESADVLDVEPEESLVPSAPGGSTAPASGARRAA